jgi:hypothetical protein
MRRSCIGFIALRLLAGCDSAWIDGSMTNVLQLRPCPRTRSAVPVCCSIESLKGQLLEAKNAVADAANAEARLRNMVATANKNADRANASRQAAEEKLEDLKLELDALRQLYAEEVARNAEDDEVAQVARAVGAADMQVDELEGRLSAALAETSALRTELIRTQGVAEDTQQELEAVRVLAGEEEAALLATIEKLTEKLKRAESNSGAADFGNESTARTRELEEQVESLLQTLAQSDESAMELMQLRPKMAELEQQLAEARAE